MSPCWGGKNSHWTPDKLTLNRTDDRLDGVTWRIAGQKRRGYSGSDLAH